VCGNGIHEDGEQCDEGDDNSPTGTCTDECMLPNCGDGQMNPGEECDDGNDVNTDDCRNDCADNVCGDGVLNQGVEECDEGDTDPGGECTPTCTIDSEKPTFVSGIQVDDTHVSITFSEDMGDVAGVDPTKFRIAFSGYYDFGGNAHQTFYYDLDVDPNTNPKYQPQAFVKVSALENDQNDATKIILTLDGDLIDACAGVAFFGAINEYEDVDLHLHYTKVGIPQIEDLYGNDLEAIAPLWADLDGELKIGFSDKFPLGGNAAPIPCL
jgi:cysteine-rich repeat protein